MLPAVSQSECCKTRMCSSCNKRPRRFSYHGKVKGDRTHDMCMQCYRDISESNRQKLRANA